MKNSRGEATVNQIVYDCECTHLINLKKMVTMVRLLRIFTNIKWQNRRKKQVVNETK